MKYLIGIVMSAILVLSAGISTAGAQSFSIGFSTGGEYRHGGHHYRGHHRYYKPYYGHRYYRPYRYYDGDYKLCYGRWIPVWQRCR